MDDLIHECLVYMRISTNNDDVKNEVRSLILACLKDLNIKGISSELTTEDIDDPLIARCVKLYVKGNFNTLDKDSERLIKSYEMLRDSLSLTEEYNEIN